MDEKREDSNLDHFLRALGFFSVLVVNVIVWGVLITIMVVILND